MSEKKETVIKPTGKSGQKGKKQTLTTNKKVTPKKPKTKLHDLSEAENKLKEMHDKYLRLSAEFDNFRKRTLKEKADLTKFAGEDLLVSLLPVMDDFDRAVQSLDKTEDIQSVKDGIMLIYNKFSEFLKQKGLEEIESLNETFNTDCHEAITKIPAPEKKLKGKVVDVIEKGYNLNGKVVRYSKVVVGD